MGKIVEKDQACLKCESSDARQIYEDGSSYCFSCKTNFKSNETKESVSTPVPKMPSQKPENIEKRMAEIAEFTVRGIKSRDITKTVTAFYGVKMSYDTNGEVNCHYYPYISDNKIGYKIRHLPKTFSYIGDAPELFGRQLFQGGGKRLVITEGEIDALTVAQANIDHYKRDEIYPTISLSSSTNTAALLKHRDWIRSFQEVILLFDMDEAGKRATDEAVKIIGVDKVKVAKLPEKDPSDVYVKYGAERLLQCIWRAESVVPAGIISKEALWLALEKYNEVKAVPYPDCLSGVNSKLKGMRRGEIVLFTAGTGSGKSTVMREIMVHIIEGISDKIGIISLEESPQKTARQLSAMAINVNASEEDIPIDQIKKGFDKLFGDDKIVLLDHQGSIKDGSIISQLEYMCLVGCKYIFIDHITILVSEGSDGLSGNEAIDKVMNDLLRIVTKYDDVWIGLISHLRKSPAGGKSFEAGNLPSLDDIKGSGSIKQICFDIIAFARNLTAEDENERNTILMSVLKARVTGKTGPVPGATYNDLTGRLVAAGEYVVEDLE